jgi:hypothetical protein
MRNERFWTGLAIVACPVMLAAYALAPRPPAPSGAVDGTVLYHGRPLADGQIYFHTDDPKRGTMTRAVIDSQGHFECDPNWERDPRSGVRYRILVVPGPRHSPRDSSPSDHDGGPEGVGRPGSGRDGERGADRRVVLASLRRGVGDSTDGDGAPDEPRRPRKVTILQDEVWLSPGPAHIEIDLDD